MKVLPEKSRQPEQNPSTKTHLDTFDGFTLLEVLAALLIMAFTMFALTQISGTSAKSSRVIAEKTGEVWQNEGVVLTYINLLKSVGEAELPDNYIASFSQSPSLSEEEAEILGTKGYRLRRLRIRSVNPPEQLFDGDILQKSGPGG